MTDYTVAVLEDAIQLLGLLETSSDDLTLAELTQASGLVKNKVFRLLFTLEKNHLVERDEAGRYRLGLRFLAFGQHIHDQSSLLKASDPALDWLVAETHETIFLGVVSGTDALCIAVRESPRSIRLFAQVGRRVPMYFGGIPKVLLAFMPDVERESLLADVASPEREALTQRLAQISVDGYAVVVDELDTGAHSIAAPIRDYRGRVIAALSIAGPSHRFSDECVARYIPLALEAADQISASLGFKTRQPHTNGIVK
ncbi:MAG: IclR family transcriptional regulator [Burkholderiales bacterium]|nr:IclR family transcriptional regulator [Anaerolineae bacterium]